MDRMAIALQDVTLIVVARANAMDVKVPAVVKMRVQHRAYSKLKFYVVPQLMSE